MKERLLLTLKSLSIHTSGGYDLKREQEGNDKVILSKYVWELSYRFLPDAIQSAEAKRVMNNQTKNTLEKSLVLESANG